MLQAHKIRYILKDKNLLDHVSLHFEPGYLYGVLGPNGAGKSTLFKVLTGIWTPTHGEVHWNGTNLLQRSRREISRTVSLVPQNPAMLFDFSVEQFVEMGSYAHDIPASTQWALSAVDAWALRHRLMRQLSGGERQRIYIARALMTQSPVIFLDEPTNSLDIGHQIEIWQLLRQLVTQGKVIVVATHDLSAVQKHCDQVVLLYQGRCEAQGGFSEVLNEERAQRIFGVSKEVIKSLK